MMANESAEGNARYRGYVMDLIDEIAKEIGFKYEFYLVPDGNYGSYNKVTKKWDGLIKELLDRVRAATISLLQFQFKFNYLRKFYS